MLIKLIVQAVLASVVSLALSMVSNATEKFEYMRLDASWYPSEDGEPAEIIVVEDFYTINTRDRTLLRGHTVHSMEVCNNRKYTCLASAPLNFAVEKKWNGADGSSWEVDGFRYTNKGTATLMVFGRNKEFFVIESKNLTNDEAYFNPNIFYYSKRYGVVGFSLFYPFEGREGYFSTTYFIVGKKGFGAK